MRSVERWEPYRQTSGPSELWGVAVKNSDPLELIIRPTTKLDGSDCQLISATHNAALATGEKSLYCESLVNHKGEPIIQIAFGSELAQLGIREARHHVAVMNEVIEAAMSDAVIVRFMREVVLAGSESELINANTGKLLQMFRDFREEVLKPTPIESEAES